MSVCGEVGKKVAFQADNANLLTNILRAYLLWGEMNQSILRDLSPGSFIKVLPGCEEEGNLMARVSGGRMAAGTMSLRSEHTVYMLILIQFFFVNKQV